MDKYTGFSTIKFLKNKNFKLTNVDLIKQDILNHIFTRKGERVQMYDWGTRIPDLINEPLDETSLLIVKEDLAYVFDYDPRLSLNDLTVIPLYDENAIIAFADVSYTYLNFNDQFDIRIDFSD
jgi:phage baseplate assembly protein W